MAKQISDEKLLELLLVHGGVSGAAATCGLSKNAIYRRLQDEAFRSRYESMQGVLLSAAAGSMGDAVGSAVTVRRRHRGHVWLLQMHFCDTQHDMSSLRTYSIGSSVWRMRSRRRQDDKKYNEPADGP